MDNSSKQHLAIWTPRDVQNPGRDVRNERSSQSSHSNWAVSSIIGDWTPSFLSSVIVWWSQTFEAPKIPCGKAYKAHLTNHDHTCHTCYLLYVVIMVGSSLNNWRHHDTTALCFYLPLPMPGIWYKETVTSVEPKGDLSKKGRWATLRSCNRSLSFFGVNKLLMAMMASFGA